MGESDTYAKIVVGKTEWKASLRDLGVKGRMILKWILKKTRQEDLLWIQAVRHNVQSGTVLHMIYTIAQCNVSEDVTIKMAVRNPDFAW